MQNRFPGFRLGKRLFSSKTHYEQLGVSTKASLDDIRLAYNRKVKSSHPDLNQKTSTEDFQQTLDAFKILSNEQQRTIYDVSIGLDILKNPPSSHGVVHGEIKFDQKIDQHDILDENVYRQLLRQRGGHGTEEERLRDMEIRSLQVKELDIYSPFLYGGAVIGSVVLAYLLKNRYN